MKYGLFLGCNMPAIRPDVERAIRLSMPRLGVELEDLDGYVCCPAFGTFPSMDQDAHLAVSAWNLSLGEQRGLDLMVECGSCYSSLRTGRALMLRSEEARGRANERLAASGRTYGGQTTVRHVTDVLLRDVGLDRIRKAVSHPLAGMRAVVQYPCHTLFPSDVVGFEECSVRPHGLADLVEALGAQVEHYSCEYQCCGGAGGFHTGARGDAARFTQRKLDAILAETGAQMIVVSCITCLMYLDGVQRELSGAARTYALPVFDYNQILALALGFPAREVAAISTVPREGVTGRFAA
jgi:heterodisulfide reductase subunit B